MILIFFVFILVCLLQSTTRSALIPSIRESSIFDNEISVVSANLWPSSSEPSWIPDILGGKNVPEKYCTITLAVLAQHTNPNGHQYDICSENKTRSFAFHPRRFVAETSPYMRRFGNFNPVLEILLSDNELLSVFCR